MTIKFHHNSCASTESSNPISILESKIDLTKPHCIQIRPNEKQQKIGFYISKDHISNLSFLFGVLTWGSSQTNCIELVLDAFSRNKNSKFVKFFESEPAFNDNKTQIIYSCYVDPVRRICILFLDGNKATCDSRNSTKHETLIAYATIFSVCHLVLHVQLTHSFGKIKKNLKFTWRILSWTP